MSGHLGVPGRPGVELGSQNAGGEAQGADGTRLHAGLTVDAPVEDHETVRMDHDDVHGADGGAPPAEDAGFLVDVDHGK